MFIRRKTVKGRIYYQAIETYRDGDRVRHRTVASLGGHPTPHPLIAACTRHLAKLRIDLYLLAPLRKRDPAAGRRCADLERKIGATIARRAKLKEVAKRLRGT